MADVCKHDTEGRASMIIVIIVVIAMACIAHYDQQNALTKFNAIPRTYDWDRCLTKEVVTYVGNQISFDEYCRNHIYYSGIVHDTGVNKTFALLNRIKDDATIPFHVSIGEKLKFKYWATADTKSCGVWRWIRYEAKAEYEIIQITESFIRLQRIRIYDMDVVVST